MNQEQLIQLGELYRNLRIARGLKLKDIARENLSLSHGYFKNNIRLRRLT